MRTLGSFNHSGPMKSRSRSCYDNSPLGLWRVAIRRPAAWLGWPPEPGHSSWNGRTLTLGADTRAGGATRNPPITLAHGTAGYAALHPPYDRLCSAGFLFVLHGRAQDRVDPGLITRVAAEMLQHVAIEPNADLLLRCR